MITATKLDPRCCASNCPRCPFIEPAQPPHGFCSRCDATVYVDDKQRCIPCGERVEGGGE